MDLESPLVRSSDPSIETAQRKLLLGTLLCFLFMVAEIVGGFWAHSLAVMTDAAHMLSDVAGCVPVTSCISHAVPWRSWVRALVSGWAGHCACMSSTDICCPSPSDQIPCERLGARALKSPSDKRVQFRLPPSRGSRCSCQHFCCMVDDWHPGY